MNQSKLEDLINAYKQTEQEATANLDELRQQIEDLLDEDDSPWYPELGSQAFLLKCNGDVVPAVVNDLGPDLKIFNQGNLFETEEEAIDEANLRKATQVLKEAIAEANDGESGKYFVGVNSEGNLDTYGSGAGAKIQPSWYYIKDQKTLATLVNQYESEFKTYLEQ